MVTFIYDRRVSRYRFAETNQLLSPSDLVDVLNSSQRTLSKALTAVAESLLSGDINLDDFEAAVAELMKNASLQVMTLAGGGEDNIRKSISSRRFFKQANTALTETYKRIQRLADRIAASNITRGQLLDQMNRLSLELFSVYSRAEILKLMSEQGFNQARRSLDLNSRHCLECPFYSSGRLFIPIEDIVPIGHACSCGGRCRCSIEFRFNRKIPTIGTAKLDEFVKKSVSLQ